MSIDLTGLERLGSIGLEKIFTEIPKGQAKEGIQFAFKIKKVAWVDGKYGYQYHCDVVIRTLDMQTVLASKLWKVYPSLFPPEVVEAIDTDTYDGNWYLVYTEINPGSKAIPPRTRLHYIDTQQGIDAHSGPSNLPQSQATVPDTIEQGGKPAPGEAETASVNTEVSSASPGTICSKHSIEKCPSCHPEEWA
jgi:hypothetical protein